MKTVTYEVATWEHLSWATHYGEVSSAATIAEAFRNRTGPADTIVAVEDGKMRELNSVEKFELALLATELSPHLL